MAALLAETGGSVGGGGTSGGGFVSNGFGFVTGGSRLGQVPSAKHAFSRFRTTPSVSTGIAVIVEANKQIKLQI